MSQEVLGIRLPEWAHLRWPLWFAPERLPFVVDALGGAERSALPDATSGELPMELKDTFWTYSAQDRRVWLTYAEFAALPTVLGRRLLAAQRGVHEAWVHGPGGDFGPWWRELLGGRLDPIVEFIERDCPPSRHREVSEGTWGRAAGILPWARELAGTFAEASGPNCFGTVMAAAGVDGAESVWMQREPFEEWLDAATVPVTGTGRDNQPGTVLVWRSADSAVQHAGVTLGDGWMLNKPSQGWMSPRFVWSVGQVKRHSRQRGNRLQRYGIKM